MAAKSSCPAITITIGILAIAFATYIGWACPPPSQRLREWVKTDSSYFTTRGRKIFYKDAYGEGKLELSGTILLLHGFPTMSFDWIKMWPALTKNFNRVIAVDFLGYGMSDKPIGHHYSLIEQANLVTDLLKMLQVDSFHILSHDYGDSVAQELLARHNNGETAYEIRSACLLNGGMFKETNFPRPIQNLLTASPLAGDILSLLSNRYIFGRGLSDVFGPNSQPSEEDLYDFWCGACHKEGYKSMAALLGYIGERSLHNTRWRKALQDSIAPIHVIYGPADPVNPSGFIDFYKREIVNGSIDVLVEGVGHYPQWEDSETVTKLYLQFVASNL